jgi:hypothetical protein
MKTEVKGLATVCVASLALAALIMVPALLLQPTVVHAQPQPQKICSSAGIAGCYKCGGNPSPTNHGCDGDTTPPGGWEVGTCENTNDPVECTQGTLNCGAYIYCPTGAPIGPLCATFPICI